MVDSPFAGAWIAAATGAGAAASRACAFTACTSVFSGLAPRPKRAEGDCVDFGSSSRCAAIACSALLALASPGPFTSVCVASKDTGAGRAGPAASPPKVDLTMRAGSPGEVESRFGGASVGATLLRSGCSTRTLGTACSAGAAGAAGVAADFAAGASAGRTMMTWLQRLHLTLTPRLPTFSSAIMYCALQLSHSNFISGSDQVVRSKRVQRA